MGDWGDDSASTISESHPGARQAQGGGGMMSRYRWEINGHVVEKKGFGVPPWKDPKYQHLRNSGSRLSPAIALVWFGFFLFLLLMVNL